MSTYNKPYLSFNQQVELLKSRGLIVTNDEVALEYLRRLGYYRLSGYWYTCRELIPIPEGGVKPTRPQRKDTFMVGARFQDAVDLSVFDKKLRLLVLDAIERIEVAFRVDISYLMGKKDTFAYTKPELLHGNFTRVNPKTGKSEYEEWLQKHDNLINRSKEDFTAHFKSKYGLPLPMWVSIELWDFGLLSTFYHGMTVNDKIELSTKYNVPGWQVMVSWLRCINYVRNVVAHHGRLWNRNLIDQPRLPKKGEMLEFEPYIGHTEITSRIYIVLCILAHFMKQICPRSSWSKRVVSLIGTFPNTDYFDIAHMGFSKNWQDHAFWKDTSANS